LSTLTKICVVLLVVLVLLACPIFISMATVPYSYRQLYREQQDRNDAIMAQAAHNELQLQRAVADAKEADTRAKTVSAKAFLEEQKLKASLEAALLANSGFQDELAQLNARLTKLSTGLDAERTQKSLLSQQLAETRKKNATLAEENRQVNEVLRQTKANFDRVEKQAVFLREEIAVREARIGQLEEQLAAGGISAKDSEAAAAPVAPDTAISGRIDIVREDLAQINVGSAKGVKPGMKLIISRGDQFVGYLRISEVDINSAAGFIVDKRLDPMKGDRVSSSVRAE